MSKTAQSSASAKNKFNLESSIDLYWKYFKFACSQPSKIFNLDSTPEAKYILKSSDVCEKKEKKGKKGRGKSEERKKNGEERKKNMLKKERKW